MRIGFDVTWMNIANCSGGIFHYAKRLIYGLVEHSNSTFVAIISPQGLGIFEHLIRHENFRLVLLESPKQYHALLKAEGIEVLHTPLQWHLHYTLSIPMVNSLHDLQQFHYPEFFSKKELDYREKFYRKSAEFSERVIVSFQHVKDDIENFYGISPNKIDVCPFGMIEVPTVDPNLFEGLRNKYRLPNRYLFYSAGTWRHKNHVGLIKALKLVREKHGININLICTGYMYSDYFPEIEQILKELNMTDFVSFLGYIPEEEMPLLLSNATLVVIPTLYEAGSAPLAEAMACQVPVICSNVTSLPETIGDARFLFDPNDIEQMASKIAEMLNSSEMMAENRANSYQYTSMHGWEVASKGFLASYQRAIDGFWEKRDGTFIQRCIDSYSESIDELSQKLESELDEKARIIAELEAIKGSLSWRLTALLRKILSYLR